jgi:hypothetical protein
MKKLVPSIAICSLALAALSGLSTGASADPGKEPAAPLPEFCQWFTTVDPTTNVGECLSAFRSDRSAAPAKYCGFLRDADALELYGFGNEGECIDYFKEVF